MTELLARKHVCTAELLAPTTTQTKLQVTRMNLDRPPTPTSHLAWPRNLDAYVDDATKLRVHDSDDDLRLTRTRTP